METAPRTLYQDPTTGFWNLYYKGSGKLGLLETHFREACQAPCDVHYRDSSASWLPLQWLPVRNLVFQLCKHNNSHPAPGEITYQNSKDIPDDLSHDCCPLECCKEWGIG